MNDANEARARLSESFTRTQNAINDRMVQVTHLCADALDAIVDLLGDEPQLPDVRAVIAQAAIDANTRAPKLFVCGLCFHRIDGPMIAQPAQPTPRLIHYPQCPTPDGEEEPAPRSFGDGDI